MAKSVLTNCLIALGGYNLRCSMNSVALAYEADAPECTTFCNDTHTYAEGGLKTAAISCAGFWDDGYDAPLFEAVGEAVVMTVAKSITPGDVAYFQSAQSIQYNPAAQIGQLLGVSVATAARDKLLRGTLMEYQEGVDQGDEGTGRQLGAVSSGQSLYCALHVTKADGADSDSGITVIVESDDNSGFNSPTTRLTMTEANDVTAELKSLAGPITDTYWRVKWTVETSDADYDFICSLAIQ